jgi:hypothetical protein
MKRLIWVLTTVLFATPIFAQEEGGGGGLPSSLFTGGDFGGNRGGQPNPIDAIKRFFAQAKVTFSGDQEKALKPIVETAFKQVQDTVERFNGQPAAGGERGARGQGQGGGERNQGGGERRGGGFDPGQRRGRGGPGGANASNPQLAAELQKLNDEVLPKIVAVLKPDQQVAFKKWQNDEIKKGGGFAALKINMEEAGAPLTAAQEPQIRAFYVEDTQQRLQLQREGQGVADPAKIAELEKTTLSKVIKLLTPEQRKALLDTRTKQ